MSEPFFSIVIPTYNRAHLIGKTLDTFFQQIFFSFEIIVVDDGSTDNTPDIIKSYCSDSRVQYYKKENEERGAARNYGAKLAKGKYVNFFDSDDLAYPNHLLEAYKAIQKWNNPKVFHLGYDMRTPDGHRWIYKDNLPETVNEILINGNHLSCNGVFIRKDVTELHPFSEDRILSASEDYALWLQLAARYPLYCSNAITSTIVDHEARSVVNINLEKFLMRMERLKTYLQCDQKFLEVYKGQWNKFISYRDVYIALHLGMARYPILTSLKFLTDSVKVNPSVIFSRRFGGALKNIFLRFMIKT